MINRKSKKSRVSQRNRVFLRFYRKLNRRKLRFLQNAHDDPRGDGLSIRFESIYRSRIRDGARGVEYIVSSIARASVYISNALSA